MSFEIAKPKHTDRRKFALGIGAAVIPAAIAYAHVAGMEKAAEDAEQYAQVARQGHDSQEAAQWEARAYSIQQEVAASEMSLPIAAAVMGGAGYALYGVGAQLVSMHRRRIAETTAQTAQLSQAVSSREQQIMEAFYDGMARDQARALPAV